ncbi:3-oxoacyl-[acyl-carrier-protein] reductase [Solimonas aquatica]|uniref:3-oxoacyl-[acyl-carrier-protein] reductase n=1 Tax=Solimonas aquatica TaxID=489703 RepID=A0A1H9HTJ1_9GAMM|nr:3-oxoacyl-ACP reductase FabG [Solimonas aquatica]SEQ65636.1 3-oxoacyl-[acyl-carrier-protein] reductase [Solimonas aquatica]
MTDSPQTADGNRDTVLVTGASRGIGQAIALRFAKAGAKVYGTATSESGAQAISATLAPYGGEGRVLDVRDGAAVEALLSSIGTLSVLVNNAGVTRDTLMLRMKDEDWDQVIQTDLTSVFRLSRAVLRGMMKARYGRIISIGSVVGSMGNPGQANYCAAKAGLIGFSKSLAQEIGSRGITVNVVAPGFIDTDMTKTLSEDVRKGLMDRVPVQRLGAPEDIAAAVAFLASREAGYVTGTTLHVNGGLYMD